MNKTSAGHYNDVIIDINDRYNKNFLDTDSNTIAKGLRLPQRPWFNILTIRASQGRLEFSAIQVLSKIEVPTPISLFQNF